MGDDRQKVTHHCVCGRCGTVFEVSTECGPSELCGICSGIILAFIRGEISAAAMERKLRKRKHRSPRILGEEEK